VDANHQNSELLAKVREVVLKLEFYISKMIELGQKSGEIKSTVSANLYAKRIFALIEGAVFMTVTMNDDSYLSDMMDHADELIVKELIK
jgi:hypothetical protein